jgi:beta-lactamase superfamily II metal-dependent hydrolase
MRAGAFDNGVFEVYALNTGQSDARFVIGPDGSTHLIDADETDVANELDGVLEERTSGADAPDFEDAKHLDTVVATHIHRDHVKGMNKLVERGYETNQLIRPDPDRYNVNGRGEDGPGVDLDIIEDYQNAAERMVADYQLEFLLYL